MDRDDRTELRDERRQEQVIPPDGAEDTGTTVRLYNVAPEDMPPAAAGANAEIGGEAAASRRVAGLPEELERKLGADALREPEPFLGYDGLPTDDLLEWIDEADPDPGELRALFRYERHNRGRDAVLQELSERLRRNGERPAGE